MGLGRRALSLIAFIADDERVQAALPQSIIGNENLLQLHAMEELRADPLACSAVSILCRTSSWVNTRCLVRSIQVLGEALTDVHLHTLLFAMDARPCHTALPVIQEIARQGLHAVFIPASMTGCLQLLDTHDRAVYKRSLNRET